MKWNETAKAELRHRWEVLQQTSNQIAVAMNTTKNSIVAKAHRLGLSERDSPIIRNPDKPPVMRPVERAGLYTLGQEVELEKPVALFRPCRTCQWPLTKLLPSGRQRFEFCEADVIRGRPYCVEHARMVFVSKAVPESDQAEAA